jgi:predicted ABC-type ATPase
MAEGQVQEKTLFGFGKRNKPGTIGSVRSISSMVSASFDGDNDGRINDNTPFEAPAPPKKLKRAKLKASKKRKPFTGVLERPTNTKYALTDQTGRWNPLRKKFHDSVVEKYLAKAEATPKSDNPTVFVLGGGPATRKSSALDAGVLKNSGALTKAIKVDTDELKDTIPEYGKWRNEGIKDAASLVHEESKHLNDRVTDALLKEQSDVIYDTTGDGRYSTLEDRVKFLRSEGHRIVAHYMTNEIETARKLNEERFAKTGRKVPTSQLLHVHATVSDIIPRALKNDLFDEFYLYDSDDLTKSPKLIASKEMGKSLRVYDVKAWKRFTRKADVLKPKPKPENMSPAPTSGASNWDGSKIPGMTKPPMTPGELAMAKLNAAESLPGFSASKKKSAKTDATLEELIPGAFASTDELTARLIALGTGAAKPSSPVDEALLADYRSILKDGGEIRLADDLPDRLPPDPETMGAKTLLEAIKMMPRPKRTRKRVRRVAAREVWEQLNEYGVTGIDTLPGGGLVSAPAAKARKARSDRLAATPAPRSDQIRGSRRNAIGSAASRSSGSEIEISEATEASLTEKVRAHNEKVSDESQRTNLRTLKSVYRRGAGAFSGSHRPGMARGQWAMGRVNAFLEILSKGKPDNARYVGDNDLLPDGHPWKAKTVAVKRYDFFARDGDFDGMVQDGTDFSRSSRSISHLSISRGRKPKKSTRLRLRDLPFPFPEAPVPTEVDDRPEGQTAVA